MIITSAQAAKLLKKYNEDYEAILEREKQTSVFLAALGEDPETVRPEYCYNKTKEELEAVESKVRKIKHALNVFNTTHKVPGFDMTVDEMLVFIPQLTKRKEKLAAMRANLPKSRVKTAFDRFGGSSIIDYLYTNYDMKTVKADYEETSDILSQAQTALDKLNSTETFEIEL